ncbi:MAG: AAA family ATPase [Clostridiales bacterium]|nr:AAA family ATPase [Clostridiales bacterium]
MPMPHVSNDGLYGIGRDNYERLVNVCRLLEQEAYWENPREILHFSIFEMLDRYIQSVLVCQILEGQRERMEEYHYARVITNQNVLMLPESLTPECPLCQLTDICEYAKKMVGAPPILIQLCGLRDREKDSCLSGVFLDCMINLVMVMGYLGEGKSLHVMPCLENYYRKVRPFLNQDDKNKLFDDRYLFRKITTDSYENGYYEKLLQEYSQIKENVGKAMEGAESLAVDFSSLRFSEEQKKEEIAPEYLPQEEDTEDDGEIKPETDLSEYKLESLLEELNSLVGLSQVKEQIHTLINLIKVRKMREKYQMPQLDMTYHMAFTGNPGTGKTTVARLVAAIYKELGILSKGTFIETDRSGLVAGYVGQTAMKVREVVEKALGGVLFIDEAYSLANPNTANDFGGEAIDMLVKLMEDHRDDLVVIVAGYTEEMDRFLHFNTGLLSRFNTFVEFPDYTSGELLEILDYISFQAGFIIEEEGKKMVFDYLEQMEDAGKKQFGNGRGIRNLFEKIVMHQANRLMQQEKMPDKEELILLKKEDVSIEILPFMRYDVIRKYAD